MLFMPNQDVFMTANKPKTGYTGGSQNEILNDKNDIFNQQATGTPIA